MKGSVPCTFSSFSEPPMTSIAENIAPFCFGYMTQYWFGLLGPMPNKPNLQTINCHSQIAFQHSVGLGIQAAILENGLVRFDFENYAHGGVFVYRYQDTPEGSKKRLHDADLDFREREVQNLAFRLVQVHAVLLDNSRRLIEHCSSYSSRPTRIVEMLRGYDLEDQISTYDYELRGKFCTPLPDEVAKKSLKDLSAVLSNSEGLFELVELYSFSLTHFLERRYSEALIAYWAAIEAALNVLWERLLAAEKSDPEAGLSKKRKTRLTNSSAFTASVIIETLYLLRQLPANVYEEINAVRSNRNKWMHELRPISERDALQARKVCENVFRHVFSFDIKGTTGGGGGAGGGLFKSAFCSRYPAKSHLFS